MLLLLGEPQVPSPLKAPRKTISSVSPKDAVAGARQAAQQLWPGCLQVPSITMNSGPIVGLARAAVSEAHSAAHLASRHGVVLLQPSKRHCWGPRRSQQGPFSAKQLQDLCDLSKMKSRGEEDQLICASAKSLNIVPYFCLSAVSLWVFFMPNRAAVLQTQSHFMQVNSPLEFGREAATFLACCSRQKLLC